MSLKSRTDELHKKLIIKALESTRGNVRLAAALLETPRRSLYNLMQRLNISPADYRIE